ncbi:unnamed protein product [Vitrella brassicaformis CCMP3155]|uniref:Uncharacterized protein n=1 Tax=Vitrella brassicaformis (strain CCMP3155) TaxID=1169540 RepID=A0A0G4EF60_VITBC|nr:unnamed protein product [Vitrella brassicaformis CCMP3155]|eukprot:CEL94159.1 unnamed protein product [Vitrella brassicaformis CCMP3155]
MDHPQVKRKRGFPKPKAAPHMRIQSLTADSDDILARVKHFLPQLEHANRQISLPSKRPKDEHAIDGEGDEDQGDDGPCVEMSVHMGVYDVKGQLPDEAALKRLGITPVRRPAEEDPGCNSAGLAVEECGLEEALGEGVATSSDELVRLPCGVGDDDLIRELRLPDGSVVGQGGASRAAARDAGDEGKVGGPLIREVPGGEKAGGGAGGGKKKMVKDGAE